MRVGVSVSTYLQGVEDPFVVVDVGRLFGLYAGWEAALPDIQPFYAVKCNEDRLLLKTLAGLGAGFDCASKVLDRGVQQYVSVEGSML